MPTDLPNPYAAPSTPANAATTYYAEELTAAPFASMARGLKNILPAPMAYAIAAYFRLRGMLRWPLKAEYAVGGIGSGTEAPREAMPPRALSRWAPILEQLQDLGFQPLQYRIMDVIGAKEQAAAVFLDSAGGTLATLEWIRLRGAGGPEEQTPLEFNSYGADDPEIMTGWIKEEHIAMCDMLRLEFVDIEFHPDTRSIARVYRKHQERVAGRSIFTMTPEAALAEHRKRAERRFNWLVGRGLLRPLRESEIAAVRQGRLAP